MTQTTIHQELSAIEKLDQIRDIKRLVLKGVKFDQDAIDEIFEIVKEDE